jgi:hypothetical protein
MADKTIVEQNSAESQTLEFFEFIPQLLLKSINSKYFRVKILCQQLGDDINGTQI